jgi:hypothetical protein
MKKIAAITMVRNDDFYLRKWVEYYGRELGRENLYIFFDGEDQEIPAFCEGTHTEKCAKIGTDVVSNDKGRVQVMSRKAAELFASGYQLVIGTDADEYIVVDPKLGVSLAAFLSEQPVDGSLSPLGLDLGQKLGEEAAIDPEKPFLSQRHYAVLGTRYTKASILAEPLAWGSGFHRVKGQNFHIAKDLYLFHAGYFDMDRIQMRFADSSRLEQGWERHLKKRSRTVRQVSSLPARDFTRWTRLAHVAQALFRPPYAWNKPGMLGLKIVVRIPDRFKDIV